MELATRKTIDKLTKMLEDAERENMYGQLEIEIRGGVPDLIRKSTTHKIEGTTHNEQQRYYR